MRFLTVLLLSLLLGSGAAFARGGGHWGSSGGSYSHSTPGGYGTGSSSASHSVSGYTRRSGTYVAPYHATNPNPTQRDNYSTKGNVNPYTGKVGTKPATR